MINNKRALRYRIALVSCTLLVLSACGGGGGTATPAAGTPSGGAPNSGGNTNNPITGVTLAQQQASAGTFVAYTPSAGVAATKKSNQNVTIPFSSGLVALTQGCKKSLSSVTVFDQTHSIVAGASDVTEADLQEAADYVEAAIKEIRTTFGITNPVAFGAGKVPVCIQNEYIDNNSGIANGLRVGGGSPAQANSFLQFVAISPSAYFKGYEPRDAIRTGYYKYAQEVYKRTILHEIMHIYSYRSADSVFRYRNPAQPGITFGSTNAFTDKWFEEGMARYMEFGQNSLFATRAELVAGVNLFNPLKVIARSGPAEITPNYDVSAAVLAYLFSSKGANNPLSRYRDFMDALHAEWGKLSTKCFVTTPPADCPDNEDKIEATRAILFAVAFEAVFKEKDGTPMKLRSGANNLQDTLASRFDSFW
jgi:hypothetical protein